MLTMRVTPKMSDSPTATKNSVEAEESPLRAWNRIALKVIEETAAVPALPLPRGERKKQAQSAAGRSFFTSASDGNTAAPSMYLKSAMVPAPFSIAIVPT